MSPQIPKVGKKISKKNGIKLVGYIFRLKITPKSPPPQILSDFSELALPLIGKEEEVLEAIHRTLFRRQNWIEIIVLLFGFGYKKILVTVKYNLNVALSWKQQLFGCFVFNLGGSQGDPQAVDLWTEVNRICQSPSHISNSNCLSCLLHCGLSIRKVFRPKLRKMYSCELKYCNITKHLLHIIHQK